jgi:hypothetical protein
MSSPAVAVGALESPGDASECDEAIDPETARQVFEAVRSRAIADGCQLSDVETERTRMFIRWTRGGQAMRPATITARSCAPDDAVAGETLALASPQELSSACPGALAAMTDAVRTLHPRTVPDTRLPSPRRSYTRRTAALSWILAAVALLGSSLVVVRALRRSPPD